ncbi:MAG: methyltransferase domain-containing protein [Actinobacteria bacterium]|nr:methyltransferase domain-containing protein [Actinomycetota bacterium]
MGHPDAGCPVEGIDRGEGVQERALELSRRPAVVEVVGGEIGLGPGPVQTVGRIREPDPVQPRRHPISIHDRADRHGDAVAVSEFAPATLVITGALYSERPNHLPDASYKGAHVAGVTRGSGILEPFLSRRRAAKADALIPDEVRGGRILDVGCGLDPLFLRKVTFAHKFGVDQLRPVGEGAGVALYTVFDAETSPRFPFRDHSFDVVTMLTVLEHLQESLALSILDAVYEVLKPGCFLILTTPPPRTDHVLRVMARFNLVSKEEIEEHDRTYNAGQLRELFERTRFSTDALEIGHFELFMNVWARIRKPRYPRSAQGDSVSA